jgi:hypothetical protein
MSSTAEKLETASGAAQTSAAKLHVLQLGPIKDRLGEKWPKLSGLVHRLFETAIRNAQGPYDHFVRLDELSYVVTFHGLDLQEATVACTAVAQQVCEKLFGGTGTDIAVRALVGRMAAEVLNSQFGDGKQIAAHLELNGQEILVSSDPGRIPPRVTKITPGADDLRWAPINTIRKARENVLPLGLEIGLFPVWELARGKSSCLHASAYSRKAPPRIGCIRQLLAGWPDRVVDAEITMLMTAHAYAHRLHLERKVCALGAAVSFETLSGFHSRIRYITALKSLTVPPECPILLKIEDIPEGALLSNVAQIIAMLTVPNVRFTVQFRGPQAVPAKVDIRLGAAGMGLMLPHHCDAALAVGFMKKLAHAFAEQKGFVFADGLDTPELVQAAQSCGMRFGTGQALGSLCFSGLDQLPSFPVSRD